MLQYRQIFRKDKQMSEPIRYITNEQGEQLSVVLDIEEYRRLIQYSPSDPELLLGLSAAELQALADSKLAPEDQARLTDLLSRNQTAELSTSETDELDSLIEHVSQLNILKTRARYTLQCSPSLVS